MYAALILLLPAGLANDSRSITITGHQTFHRLLKEVWRLIQVEPLPCWGGLTDSVRVYERLPVVS
jgi:hypothetical protein